MKWDKEYSTMYWKEWEFNKEGYINILNKEIYNI